MSSHRDREARTLNERLTNTAVSQATAGEGRTMSYLDHPISVVPRATDHRPFDQISIREALEQIRTGRYRSYVERVRSIQDKEERRKVKAQGPAYTFGGVFYYVSNAHLERHSGVICSDYDGLEDMEAAKAKLREDPHVLAFFRSTSGDLSNGLKVLTLVEPAPENNDQNHVAYDAVARHLGIGEVDRAAKDVARFCFTSWDPELHVNADAVPLTVNYPQERRKAHKRARSGDITHLKDGEKYMTLRGIGSLLRYGGLGGNMINTALQALLAEHAETPGDPEPIRKLAEWFDQQPIDGSVSLSEFRANVIKSCPLPDEVQEYMLVGASESIRSPSKREEVLGEIKSLFRTAAQHSRDPAPPTSWWVPGLFPKAAVVQLTGAPKGGGKTTLVVHSIKAMVEGGLFLGRLCERTPVVYLTEQSRQNFESEYLAPAGLAQSSDLHLVYGWQVSAYTWPDIVAAAVDKCADVGGGVLVIDTFAYFARLAGDDENSSGAVLKALRPILDAAAAQDLTVVIIHHDRKGGGEVYDSGRGSNAFQGAVDVIINLRRCPGNVRPTLREIRATGRFGDLYDGLIIELKDGHYVAHGDEQAVARAEAVQVLEQVLSDTEATAMTESELLKAAQKENSSIKKSTFGDKLRQAVHAGVVRCMGKGVKGDPYRYYRDPSVPFSQNPSSYNGRKKKLL